MTVQGVVAYPFRYLYEVPAGLRVGIKTYRSLDVPSLASRRRP